MDSNDSVLHSFYKENAGKFKYLIYRYVGNKHVAEDLLQDGFMQIISKISQFKGSGSFEGWARRIIINTTLEYLRKKKNQAFSDIELIEATKNDSNHKNRAFADEIDIDDLPGNKINMEIIYAANLSDDDLEEALGYLPLHYRLVFNLFIFEGYRHKEISKMLDIKEKTSKSRLSKARKITQTFLYKKAVEKVKNHQYEK